MTLPIQMKTPVELPALPFVETALEPVISANTLSFHHGKHHKAYVDKTLSLIAGTELEGKTLEEIVLAAYQEGKTALFNNAAQVWNHNFYWKSLAPFGAMELPAEAAALLIDSFESVEAFKKAFTEAAVGQFGSGWAWLIWDGSKLSIDKTSNALLPWVEGKKPVLTVDVWEHAYYLDYQNRRPAYVEAVLDKLVNWEFVLENVKG
ncbi:MAG: superoxide dismutase [Chloroflexi bacterium]|jgi:Fe-Mn family superoxide dismutase|nr:superoxide dismutase [Chloroflexota bacterium]HOE35595.1 superoxide dismutase [Anaerolineaceae bacterium]HOT25246.1 superoxide dismutase [Anaerolineaceae bacterium]HQH57814.1 superoxide dismutase [Anaerolineaceae bacterium]HQK02904.1 superoxide dismutase [Anaerolineaceae bacterium]